MLSLARGLERRETPRVTEAVGTPLKRVGNGTRVVPLTIVDPGGGAGPMETWFGNGVA